MKRKWASLAVVTLLFVAASTTIGQSGCPSSLPGWGENTFTIYNESSWVVMEIYLSPCSSSDWGVDQLGSSVIMPGESYTLTGVPDDCYDFMAIDENDYYWEEYGLDISGGIDFSIELGDKKNADAPGLAVGIGKDGFKEGESSPFQTGPSDFLKE